MCACHNTCCTRCLSFSFDFIQTLLSVYGDNKKDELSILEYLVRKRSLEASGVCISGTTRIRRKGIRTEPNVQASHGWRHSKVFLRRRWSMDSDNHLFASVSYHQHLTGPTHFPFLESRAAHFPDVPSVPVVKCQYGTYPRAKASLVRQHHRTRYLPPIPPPPLRPREGF